jgi:hypothetical protein
VPGRGFLAVLLVATAACAGDQQHFEAAVGPLRSLTEGVLEGMLSAFGRPDTPLPAENWAYCQDDSTRVLKKRQPWYEYQFGINLIRTPDAPLTPEGEKKTAESFVKKAEDLWRANGITVERHDTPTSYVALGVGNGLNLRARAIWNEGRVTIGGNGPC